MKIIYKILIYIGITLILCISCFIVGRVTRPKDFDTNKLTTIQYKLEEQQKKNKELLEYISNYEKILKDLETDNKTLNTKIEKIINYTNETEEKLNSVSSDVNVSLDYLKRLQINNRILLEYVNNIGVVTNE